ncbi:hypothetical protein WICMUC_000580 [Wickerhamomyces mucosus]|uniref:TECPR1-like DysF domain-containing protein n=1 Tax=Wickerhamomyces mucosus TaxID=1378264 RepID=A0A9P8PX82_9ASCO|nr:hypothetical protein WICMUC_000580 [Wickerhamomyces mucosus]
MSYRIRESITEGLDQLYKITSNYSERIDKDVSPRSRLAAATATSIIGASLDRISRRKENFEGLSDKDDDQDEGGETDTESETHYYQNNEFDLNTKEGRLEQREKRINNQRNHFIDILLEKLLLHAIPSDINKEEFEKMINNPLRKETEPLSISLFTTNIRKSTARLGRVFRVQYFIIRVFNWSNPALTLCALITYTLVILYPNLWIILPLLYIMYGIMVPAYTHRHPIRKPNLIAVKERGESLLNAFFKVKDGKQLEQFLEEDKFEQEMMRQRMIELDEQVDANTKILKSNMEFWVNMRDFQNSMTKMLKFSDSLDNFFYNTAGFKDERASTSLFFTYISIVISLLLFGKYIPWKIILIYFMWHKLLLNHPKIKPRFQEFKKKFKPKTEKIDKIVHENERKDIIIDEPPEIKQIEVFEIWRKSLTNVEGWEFFTFSNSIFDSKRDYYRKSQKPPPGVSEIHSVKCPKTWKFHEESWNIDYNCQEWCLQRGIDLDSKTYIDKNNEFLIDEGFKRRRLYRDVIRYSRPARKPEHMM